MRANFTQGGWGLLALLLILVCKLIVVVLFAFHKPLWFDEIFTYVVASLPSNTAVYHALESGVDGMPPAWYAIAHYALKLPLPTEIAVRVPSIIGYMLAMVGVYMLAKNALSKSAALVAVSFFSLLPILDYGAEARPYALVLGLTACAGAAWQRIGTRPLVWLPVFALLLSAVTALHYTAVLLLVVFAGAELAVLAEQRRFRWAAWSGICISALPFLAGWPLLAKFRATYGTNWWSRPTWGDALFALGNFTSINGLMLLTVALCFLAVSIKSSFQPPMSRSMTLGNMALINGLLWYPVAIVLIMKLAGAGSVPRYGIPGLIGITVAMAALLRIERVPVQFTGFALGAIVALNLGVELRRMPRPETRWEWLSEASRAYEELPVIVANQHQYLEAWQNGSSSLRKRIISVVDVAASAELTGADTNDRAVSALSRFGAMNVATLEWLRSRKEPILLCSGGGIEWNTMWLLAHSYRPELLAAQGDLRLYLVRGSVR